MKQQDSNKLFYTPTSGRDNPPVVSSLSDESAKQLTLLSSRTPLELFNQKMTALALGFDAVTLEYEKIIGVLANRADMLRLEMPVVSTADRQAAKALFGTLPETITFDNYILILKKMQMLSAAVTAVTVDPEQIKETVSSQLATPEVNALNTLHKSFNQYLTSKEAYEFLLVEPVIVRQQDAVSRKSLTLYYAERIDETNPVTDPGNDTPASKPGKPNSKTAEDIVSGMEDVIKDCMPCLERNEYLYSDYADNQFFNNFINDLSKNFWSAMAEVARYKIQIASPFFIPNICSVVNLFVEKLCLPDLNALLALLTISLSMIKNKIAGAFKFNLDLGCLAVDLVMMSVSAILDVVLSYMVKVVSTVLSPVDCIFTSLQYEADRLSPVVSNPLSSYEPGGPLNAVLKPMRNSERQIKEIILNLMNEKTKDWTIKIGGTEDALALYKDLSMYSQILGLINEIITYYKQLKGIRIDNLKADDLYRRVCLNGILKERPWLGVLDNVLTNTGSSYTPGTSSNSVAPDSSSNAIESTDSSAPAFNIPTPTGKIYIIDSSINSDFFKGDDISTISKDPVLKELFKDMKYNDDYENGKDIYRVSPELIAEYEALKSSVAQISSDILSSDSRTNTQSSTIITDSTPVSEMTFTSCIENNSLSGYSQEQIQAWINKVTK